MSALKITFLLAIAGHLLCGVCDCLMTYMPGGRFHFEDMKDNGRLSAVFKGMPLRNSLLSMLLGCLAMFQVGGQAVLGRQHLATTLGSQNDMATIRLE
ncbi:hypothetical protein [Paenibacillus sp.]